MSFEQHVIRIQSNTSKCARCMERTTS